MAQHLKYEQGLKCVGDLMRVVIGNDHGIPAKLIEATPRYAIVLPTRSNGRTERVEWKHVEYWVSHNGKPAPAAPDTAKNRNSALNNHNGKEMNMPTLPSVNATEHARASIAAALTASDMIDLPERIAKAVGDVKAAKAMVADAQKELTSAQSVLAALRLSAAAMLNEIDNAMK